jgi:hypothetical protein
MITPTEWQLPIPVRSRLGTTTYGRQRAIIEDGHLALILHKPPGPDDTKREGLLFWRDTAGQWRVNRGVGVGDAALKKLIQTYSEQESRLTEAYEKAHDTTALFDVLEQVTPLTRAAKNLHHALQDAREGIGDDPFLIEVRDLSYEVERNFELLLEDVRHALQYRTAREAEQQAKLSLEALKATHRLNILVAVFLPLTAIGGIFGMNLAHGLEDISPAIFWIVLLIGISLGFMLKSWVAKPAADLEAENRLVKK